MQLLSTVCAMCLLLGCESQPEPTAVEEMVFVCTKTGDLFLGSGTNMPLEHPTTGQATLMPAMYCYECERWQATVPMDVLQRSGQQPRCHRDGEALVTHGPRREIPLLP